jgi:ribosomal protein S12 methylthiotransferase
LGCAKNLADAEIMLGTLLKDGIEVTNNASEADVVIVNTCSFIDSAQQESVDAILESDELRQATNRGQGLIVSGCLPQRFREELPTLLPEVDVFMGIDQVSGVTNLVQTALARRREKLAGAGATTPHRVRESKTRPKLNSTISGPTSQSPATALPGPTVEVTARPSYIPDYATPRFRLTPRHFAYVKIAEGCNHPCSFCIIPRMRGSHRSRQQSDIVTEVRSLLAEGVKEINLISQDSTYYGMDLRTNHRPSISSPQNFHKAVQGLPDQATTICTLLRELNALPGEFWIRLLYTHPAHWTDQLIRTIAECPKVARYVDIPLQHIHENMLERMRRETSQQHIVDLIKRIRAGIPGIALRTTFIVGFPGETQACFETLLDFILEAKFERLGVFTYSQQEGTRAGAMAGQIHDGLKSKRRTEAMKVQHEIAAEVARSFVGRTIKVLVENKAHPDKTTQLFSWEHGLIRGEDASANQLHGEYLVARGEADAPDIDGRVYIRGKVPLGGFSEVKIIGHTDYDLIAKPT